MKKTHWKGKNQERGDIIPLTSSTKKMLEDLATQILTNRMSVTKKFKVTSNNDHIIITQ